MATYASDQSIDLSSLGTYEFRPAFDRSSGNEVSVILSPDAQHGYNLAAQGDDNWVLYYYTSAGGGRSALVGGNVDVNYTGSIEQRLIVSVARSSDGKNYVVGILNAGGNLKSATDANVNFSSGIDTRFYLQPGTDGIGKFLYAYYRKLG